MDPSYTIYINFWSGERHSHSTPETNGRAWTKHIGDSLWTGPTTHWIDSVKIYRKRYVPTQKSKVFHGVSMFFSIILLLVTPKIAGFPARNKQKDTAPPRWR